MKWGKEVWFQPFFLQIKKIEALISVVFSVFCLIAAIWSSFNYQKVNTMPVRIICLSPVTFFSVEYPDKVVYQSPFPSQLTYSEAQNDSLKKFVPEGNEPDKLVQLYFQPESHQRDVNAKEHLAIFFFWVCLDLSLYV